MICRVALGFEFVVFNQLIWRLSSLNSLNCPHNLAVMTHMLEQVGIAFPDTDSEVITGKKKKGSVGGVGGYYQ